MRILIVIPLVPFPLIDGGRKAAFYPIKYLAERGHEITLLCMSEKDNPDAIRELEKYCKVDVTYHDKHPTLFGVLRSLISSKPYIIRRFENTRFMSRILEKVSQDNYDLIHIEGIHSAHYGVAAKDIDDTAITLRLHNIESMNYERFIKQMKSPLLKLFLSFDNWKLKRYERTVCSFFDRVLMISSVDEEILCSYNPAIKTVVVPAGVDISYFSPEYCQEQSGRILWLGALNWRPNIDSFWWFFREIVPQLISRQPNVTIEIVGSNPPKEILALKHPNIVVSGYVEDIREPLHRASVCVVPLRAGSGIRIKLLEIFAMGKAAVSTSIGCEGLDVKDDMQLLVRDDPSSFADAVHNLLNDKNKRYQIGKSARDFVVQYYGWEIIAELYEKTFQSVLDNKENSF